MIKNGITTESVEEEYVLILINGRYVVRREKVYGYHYTNYIEEATPVPLEEAKMIREVYRAPTTFIPVHKVK